MALTFDNQLMRELTLSSRCVFNTQFIDSDSKEVLYSTQTPKIWFTRQCVTTLTRHAPSTNQPSGSNTTSPTIPQPTSPNLSEKISVVDDAVSEYTKVAPSVRNTLENGELKEGGTDVEITKIYWKFFQATLFEHGFQTKNVNEIMEKSGCRPLRFDRTLKVNGANYKWDLGLVGFESPTLKLDDGTETVIAKFHRSCLFTSGKATLELRQGYEDILDMIVMTLVWVEWRQKLRMHTMIPSPALFL